jgi:hypothetical protein
MGSRDRRPRKPRSDLKDKKHAERLRRWRQLNREVDAQVLTRIAWLEHALKRYEGIPRSLERPGCNWCNSQQRYFNELGRLRAGETRSLRERIRKLIKKYPRWAKAWKRFAELESDPSVPHHILRAALQELVEALKEARAEGLKKIVS